MNATLTLAKCALDAHHSGLPWWGYLLANAGIGVVALGGFSLMAVFDPPPFLRKISDNESAVLALAVVLFWSVGLAAGILWCTWKAPRVLYAGVRELRARARRGDPQIPSASVHKPEEKTP